MTTCIYWAGQKMKRIQNNRNFTSFNNIECFYCACICILSITCNFILFMYSLLIMIFCHRSHLSASKFISIMPPLLRVVDSNNCIYVHPHPPSLRVASKGKNKQMACLYTQSIHFYTVMTFLA